MNSIGICMCYIESMNVYTLQCLVFIELFTLICSVILFLFLFTNGDSLTLYNELCLPIIKYLFILQAIQSDHDIIAVTMLVVAMDTVKFILTISHHVDHIMM